MRQLRMERRTKPREARNPILPLDPRDPGVLRAKQRAAEVPLRDRV